jgi:hypothetical protein
MTTAVKAPTKTVVKTIVNALGKTTAKSATRKAATSAKQSTSIPTQKKIAKPASKAPATAVQTKPAIKPVIKQAKTTTDMTKAVVSPAIKTIIPKPIKAKKIKLVRDSFTIPKPEYLILDNLKLRAADLKHPVKKSELLRAGIKALDAMTDAQLLLALKAVPALKTGRPSN